jgi:hypothetical protein
MSLLIFTEEINPRKEYVFNHLFNGILGVNYNLTNQKDIYINYSEAKISYSQESSFEDDLFFKSHPIINENTVQSQNNLAFADWDNLKIPFKVANSVFDFDVFAASFYFLSRYEEYIISERDSHQRFEGKSSLAYQNNFIHRPIIDEWAYLIAKKIKNHFPNFEIKARKFEFIPTLDIDRPYYFKTDTWLKRLAKQVLKGLIKDPFDVYEQVKNWDKQFGQQTLYFLLLANKHQFDVAPSIKNPLFLDFLKQIGSQNKIGIHPSYASNFEEDEVTKEKNLLTEISKQTITKSRQHYLMLSLPKTYKNLIAAGIKEDYTLTFADTGGFRASTCTPFYWYDLEHEQITNLMLYPTAMMDQSLKKYLGLTPDESTKLLTELLDNVKVVNGTFISLWHNETIGNFGDWKGWQKVYLEMISKASKL